MKKIIFLSLVTIGGLVSILASAQEAQPINNQNVEATTSSATTKEITTQDLGVSNPGMLPSSPFYFLKEWGRTITKTFTFNSIKKAELELKYVNERAAEIKKLEEVAPLNIKAITKAAENYQKNVEQLENRLESIKQTSQNPNVDKFLDNLVERAVQHQQLFDDLRTKFVGNSGLNEQLKTAEEKINQVVTEIPKQFENAAAFGQRLEKNLKSQSGGAFKNRQAVDIINKIKDELPGQEQKLQNIEEKINGI